MSWKTQLIIYSSKYVRTFSNNVHKELIKIIFEILILKCD